MLVVVPQGAQQLGDVMVVEPVVGPSALTAHGDQAPLAEEAQLMGRSARAELGRLGQLLDRALAFEQRPQQAQPAPGAEGAHRLRERLGLGHRQRPIGGPVLQRVRHAEESSNL